MLLSKYFRLVKTIEGRVSVLPVLGHIKSDHLVLLIYPESGKDADHAYADERADH